jgi:hypothetical protein
MTEHFKRHQLHSSMVNRRKITNTNIFFSSYNLGWFVYSKNNLGQSNLKKQKSSTDSNESKRGCQLAS